MSRYEELMDKWEQDAKDEIDRFLNATDKDEENDAFTACMQILDMLKVRGRTEAVKAVVEYGAEKLGMVVRAKCNA